MSNDRRNTTPLETQRLEYPPGATVSVYITSKRIHAAKLLDLRPRWPYLYFTARWPIVRDIAHEQTRPAKFWLQDNEADMLRSEVVACYAEPEDELNTSIYELGKAVAHGKPIYLIGDNRHYKEWQFDRGIKHVGSLSTALQEITDRIKYRVSQADRIEQEVTNTRLCLKDVQLGVEKLVGKPT